MDNCLNEESYLTNRTVESCFYAVTAMVASVDNPILTL